MQCGTYVSKFRVERIRECDEPAIGKVIQYLAKDPQIRTGMYLCGAHYELYMLPGRERLLASDGILYDLLQCGENHYGDGRINFPKQCLGKVIGKVGPPMLFEMYVDFGLYVCTECWVDMVEHWDRFNSALAELPPGFTGEPSDFFNPVNVGEG